MSLLGGSEALIQFDRNAIEQLIVSHVSIGGSPLATPFELRAPATLSPLVDLVVSGVAVTFVPGTPHVVVELSCSGALIALPGQSVIPFDSCTVQLLGDLDKGAPLQFVLTGMHYAGPFDARTSAVPDFGPQVDTALTALITVGQRIDLFPDVDPQVAELFVPLLGPLGSLVPTCIDADSVATRGGGDDGTSPQCLGPGQNIAMGFSKNYVQRWILCPGLTTPPTADVSSLPATCGSGGALKTTSQGQDIYIDSVQFTFLDNAITISGVFHCSGTCWSVDGGTFVSSLTLALAGNTVVPTLGPPTLTYDVDVPFYCRLAVLAAGIVTGGIGFLLSNVVAAMAGTIAKALAHPPVSVPTPASAAIPAIEGAQWSELRVTPEGIIVGGELTAEAPDVPTFDPSVRIAVTSAVENVVALEGGEYTTSGGLVCPNATFAYQRAARDQITTLVAQPTGLLGQVHYVWTVRGVELDEVSGTLELPLTVRSAVPPLDGVALPDHVATIDWAMGAPIIGARPKDPSFRLVLTSHARDFNYSLYVTVKATDQVGRTFSWPITVTVIGDDVTFGPDYYQYQANCIAALLALVSKINYKVQAVPVRGDPGWLRGREVELVEAVRQSIARGDAHVGRAMTALVALRGNAILERVFGGPDGAGAPAAQVGAVARDQE